MRKLSRVLLALVPLPIMLVAPTSAAATQACSAISKPTVPGNEVVSVSGAEKAGGTVEYPPGFPIPPVTDVPAYCDVSVVLTHPGVGDRVTVRVWLPIKGWTGRFQGLGGGGYSMGWFDAGLAEGVKLGYAVAITDGGHDSNIDDPGSWALGKDGHVNQELLRNFASRSLHDMGVAGKAVTAQYYGRTAKYSYWNGCSTGGRQGLMNAQRYPDDYDGINANAPGINWDRFLVGDLWPQVVMAQEKNAPTVCELDAFEKAAIDACDRDDGVADRVINEPKSCHYNPYSLVGTKVLCDGKELTISRADAEVVRKIWDGPHGWFGYNRGTDLASVAGPEPFKVASTWVQYFVKEDPAFDVTTMTYRDYYRVFAESQRKYNAVIGTDDPDLSAFRASGGKMVTFHGTDDSLIPYQGTVDYRDRVGRRMSDVDSFYRVFIAPGVDHCGGGAGPNPVDPLAAVVDWVEKGKAPQTLSARTTDGTATRELCVYPLVSKYNGYGDPKSATSYTCRR
jgi:hypothetical protein